ncbi:DUF6612 family protein [Evansella tamaricis]|uniref:Lipoprotein n=1 Tax=Evansella tamaricis TaxID=2069301 RepID=A0ABS6JFX4_9BACI|nr:DUF6612 family protein [Evansella tamaricis]MBU9712564.1 hypothetical protein [Evansella tamaricis]
MKKIVFIITMFFLVLTACIEINIGSDDALSEPDQESQPENSTLGLSEEENPSESHEDDTGNENTAEDKNSDNGDDSAEMDNVTMDDAKSILSKSAEVMAEVTSFHIEGDFLIDLTTEDYHEKETVTIIMDMVLGEKPMLHMQAFVDSNMFDDEDTDTYWVDSTVYVMYHDEKQWYTMPTDNTFEEVLNNFNIIDGEQMEKFVQITGFGSFDMSENENQYILSFKEDGEGFLKALEGKTIFDVDSDWLFETYDTYDPFEGGGTLELYIEKDTFYLMGYLLEYEFKGENIFGGMEKYYRGSYAYSAINELNEIVVPDEVKDDAISIFGN